MQGQGTASAASVCIFACAPASWLQARLDSLPLALTDRPAVVTALTLRFSRERLRQQPIHFGSGVRLPVALVRSCEARPSRRVCPGAPLFGHRSGDLAHRSMPAATTNGSALLLLGQSIPACGRLAAEDRSYSEEVAPCRSGL
jgi:hypothetical protein